MKLREAIKPISYLKAHASEIVRESAEEHKTFIITQNGEAKVVVQDLDSYEKTRESLALLKMLALSRKSRRDGRTTSMDTAFKRLRSRIEEV
jgi:prevent-host-death family protein